MTLLEVVFALSVVFALLAMLLPALATARLSNYREQCLSNQRRLGVAWDAYLEERDGQFPYVPVLPGWRWGGVRFSAIDGQPFIDTDRPLGPFLEGRPGMVELFRCPADRGIRGETEGVGTGTRTAYEAFGTSYRANDHLFDAARNVGAARAEPGDLDRGLRVAEIATTPSRLVLLGIPLWAEIRNATGRDADWFGDGDMATLLFLDGSTRYQTVPPPGRAGPAVFEPRLWWEVAPLEDPSRLEEAADAPTGAD